MDAGRRQFADEFKREPVALLASSGRPLTQIVAEFGIAPSMLRNWRGRRAKCGAGVAPRQAAPAPHFVPDRRQRSLGFARENDRLRWEIVPPHPSHPIMRRLGADLEEKQEPV